MQRLSFSKIIPRTIIQIGCGGTGSYLTPNLCRLLSHYKTLNNVECNYTLIDADQVENKNLLRQNFISADLGKNKAEVLCQRYGKIFGISMDYSDKYLSENNRNILDLCDPFIIIGCVDNHATRKIIGEFCKNHNRYNNSMMWIDSGNELANGQVFISGAYKTGPRSIANTNILDAFPNIGENDGKDHPDNLSCADRVTTGEQSIAVNIMAANTILNVVDSLFRIQPIPYYQVTFGINNSMNKYFIDDYEKNVKKKA